MKVSELTKNRNIFKEYISLTDGETKDFILDKNTIWVLDANILLEALRLDQKEEEKLISFFSENINKIWIPYQAMKEFTRNYHSVIIKYEKELENSFTELSEEINNHIKKLQDQKERANIFTNHTKKKPINKHFLEAEKNLKEVSVLIEKNKISTSTRGETFFRILDLFDGKVGAEADRDTLEKWIDKFNNSSLILPGFKDKGKDEETHEDSCYGDYFIFQYMKGYSLDHNKNILFISNDEKEDWVRSVKGQKKGLWPHVRKEFINDTNGQDIQIISLNSLFHHLDKSEIDTSSDFKGAKTSNRDRLITRYDGPTSMKHSYYPNSTYEEKYYSPRNDLPRRMQIVTKNLKILNKFSYEYIRFYDEQTNDVNQNLYLDKMKRQIFIIDRTLENILAIIDSEMNIHLQERDREIVYGFRSSLDYYHEIQKNLNAFTDNSLVKNLFELERVHFQIVDIIYMNNLLY